MYTTRSHSRAWVVVLILLATAAAGANWFFHFHNGEPPTIAPTPASEQEDLRVVCFGHVDVEFGVRSLYPLQGGRIVEVLVHEGDAVKSAAPILRLDDHQARYLLQQAQADWKAAQAQLAQARKGPAQHQSKIAQQKSAIDAADKRASAARHAHDRKRSLAKIQQLSAEEVAAAEDLLKEAEAGARAEREKLRELELVDPRLGITQAEEDVAAKRARVDQAEHGLAECTLRAPCDGVVLRVLVGPGDVLGPQPRMPAVQFCPNGPRFIRGEVTQEFADQVRLGAAAEIQNDNGAADSWHGKVTHVSDWYTQRRSILLEPLQVNDVRTLECIVSVDPGQPLMRIGQRVRVIIGDKSPR